MTSSQTISGKIGFLGFGNMGGSIARGLVEAKQLPSTDILVCDLQIPDSVLTRRGYTPAPRAQSVFKHADIVILAVKPQVFADKAEEWSRFVSGTEGKTVISVMAGIRTGRLESVFRGWKIIRVMPNLGLSVGEGVTAIAMDSAPEKSLQLVETIFQSCGTTVRVSEDQMDAVTAVSGSGPMYLFEFVGAMTEAGVKAGLSRDVAYALAVQTAKGSLKLLETSTDTPDTWTQRVCSPGGTTLAALDVLKSEGFHAILERAVAAAKKRSEELSGG
jgi:pyrroline-5-carboxylate reductase